MKGLQPIKIEKLDYATPPSDALWQRRDLMLVAAGSGPCLRELYYRALAHGRLSQLMLCRTTAEDYTMGSAEEKIMQTLRKAAAISGVQVVVLYLNCLDVLTRLDFDYIEQSLTEETGVTVRCFFRGPLGKMDIRHFMPVQKFLQSLPPESGHVKRPLAELPPLATDIAGVMDCLPQAEAAKVLVAPSGCQACLRDGDLQCDSQEQYYLDTKKQDFIYGIEESCQEQCEALLKERPYKSLNLISSAVASFIGFDGDWVAQAMKKENFKTRTFNMDGFNDAVYGAGCAQELLLEEEADCYDKFAKEVLICGYTSLLCGAKEQYAECLDYIRSLGYAPRLAGEEAGGRPALCWVVSAAGIRAAKKLNEKYAVPLLISCPVGEHAMKMWKKNVRELCVAEQNEVRQLCIHNFDIPETDERRLLFIGEPVQTMGLAHRLWHEGFHHIQLAAPCNTPGSRKLYRLSPGADKWLILVDSLTALQDLWEDADIVFADTLLADVMQAAGVSEKQVIPLPWGVLSGRSACTAGSGVLGKDIALELEKLLNK